MELEALCGDKTAQELSARHQVCANQLSTWKRNTPDGLVDVFADTGRKRSRELEKTVEQDSAPGRGTLEEMLRAAVRGNNR